MSDTAKKYETERTRRFRSTELSKEDGDTIGNIEQFGCSVIQVKESSAGPGWSYTLGVYDTSNRPEIIVVGLRDTTALVLLNEAAKRLREGVDLTRGRHREMIGEVECEFRPVDPKWIKHLMGWASWYYEGADFPVLQAVYPDLENRFPQEQSFDLAFQQPLMQPDTPMTTVEDDFWASADPKSSMFDWKFPDPPHTRVFLSKRVHTGIEQITYVSHDEEDGAWQFLGDSMSGGDAPVISCFHHPVDNDPSLCILADLPIGWWAERTKPGEPWKRHNIGHGMSPEEARRRALVRFGGVQQAKEQQREARGLPWLDILLQDLRYTLRTLRRDSGFTIIAILILALGIGANIVVFSVVDTILLRPLPFPEANRLVRIAPKVSKCGASCATYSTDAVQEFQRQNKSFSDFTGYDAFTAPGNWKLTGAGVPLPVSQIDVMDNFFHTLGVQPLMGRLTFTAEESRPNGPHVVVLSYPFWKRQLDADRNIIGKAISFGNTPTTVVGVLPDTFDFGAVYAPGTKMDVFTPYLYDQVREYGNMISLTGRLNPGVTFAQAQAEADLLFPTLNFSVKRGSKAHYTAHLWDLKDFVSGSLRRSLIILWGAVGLILLIVCVNLSNLLLARAASRSKEFAMRSALGAARSRIVRQLLTESLVLSAAGAILGLGLAFAAVFYLAHQGSIALPLLSSIRIDKTALAWTLFIAVTAGLLFGIVPGLRIASGNLQDALKDSAVSTTGGQGTTRLRSTLVVSQIALACVLLIGAGLLLRSFLRVLDVDLGFEPSRASAVLLDNSSRIDTAAKIAAYDREVIHRVEQVPGVQTAAITDSLPMSRNRSWGISAKGKHYEPDELPGTFVYVVTPGYLNAIGMRIIKGRDMTWEDNDPKQAVVIINETVARYLWPNEDPIDRIAVVGGSDARVIGVIADVRETSAEAKSGWQMYLSVAAPQYGANDSQLVIRSSLPAETLQPTVLAVLRQLNPGQPAADLKPTQLLVDRASSPRRFFVYLVGIFAALGLLLAALGIYGVISYSVTQRTQEIGIRMALGATQRTVQLGIIRQTLRMALLGIVVGAVASLAVSSLIASLLFGTAPTDPATFALIFMLLVAVALTAGYIPARRASRIDPMVALRNN